MTWVNDAHYMVIPKGVPPEKVAAVLDLMAYLLTPEAQAYTYDKGYFYPGPAVKNVSAVDGAEESQDAIKEYGRPEYEGWLAQFPHTQSLRAQGAGRERSGSGISRLERKNEVTHPSGSAQRRSDATAAHRVERIVSCALRQARRCWIARCNMSRMTDGSALANG